ncbi:MAG: helix-hairpin-helix domain-containing protein [Anaerolineales bacterium]|nr:helix-hairpin-helix domain-containing protein [Anaerolineales bacterium]
MTDFLYFLNTADLSTLTKVPGITRPIAGNIIAARPFDSVNDCLKVKGMGKALLAKLELFAEAQEIESENKSLVPVEEEPLPVPFEQSQSVQEEEPSFWSRLGKALLNFLRALIRLILIAAFIVGVGAILYYGLPYINRTFIAPVEKNTSQINKLEADIAALQTELDETKNRVTALETSVEAHTASIEKLADIQASLEIQLEDNNDKTLIELRHQVMTTRALDMLGRARLYLAQSNFGLAREDVKSARDLLAALQAEAKDEARGQAIARLDMALGNLPAFPVVAAGDLEIAWQILMSGGAPATTTPEPTIASTPTVESTLEVTPTATP